MFLAKTLNQTGANWKITIPDVQKLIIEREAPKQSSWLSRFGESNQLFKAIFKRFKDDSGLKAKYGFGDYHSYETIMKYLDDVERGYPNIAKTFIAGKSAEGRPLKGIKIGNPISSTDKRVIWIDGGIHAREWAAVHTALWFIHQLISTYEIDSTTRSFIDSLSFYILPLANPDGYEFSRDDITPLHRLWRKNRGDIRCKLDLRWFRERCCGGVDLNRNFDFHWAETGSSTERCSEVFQGDTAFSEPESRAIRDMLMSPELHGKTDAFITLHTYAQMWIHPYSNQERTYPEDVQDLREVGLNGVAALEKDYGTAYRFGTGADILYPSSGGSDDWAKGVAKVKYVYLLELRPADEVWDGFLLDPRQLIPTGKETWDGIKVVVQAVLDRARANRPELSPSIITTTTTPPPTTTTVPWWKTSTTQKTTTRRVFTPRPVAVDQSIANLQQCVDRSPWCSAWLQGNPDVCRISSIYMRRDCSRSCGFCRARQIRFIPKAHGLSSRVVQGDSHSTLHSSLSTERK
ncbi:unnamed protein product, partial [Mesorhabditis belari]|uniref:ShKT domain-containing protein n=1 Tax=Mesorhabditis belari TaxID=2138241 RepID=A0AAF3F7I9_9BILA